MSIPLEVIDGAMTSQKATGLWASLTIAQWALESDWGKDCPGNNPFGITYSSSAPDSQLLWTHEYVKEDHLPAWKNDHPELIVVSREANGEVYIKVQRKFAKFPTLADAFAYHARLITEGHPYAAAWEFHKHDAYPMKFIDAFAHIYATDPLYGPHLKEIISNHDLLGFDKIKGDS